MIYQSMWQKWAYILRSHQEMKIFPPWSIAAPKRGGSYYWSLIGNGIQNKFHCFCLALFPHASELLFQQYVYVHACMHVTSLTWLKSRHGSGLPTGFTWRSVNVSWSAPFMCHIFNLLTMSGMPWCSSCEDLGYI